MHGYVGQLKKLPIAALGHTFSTSALMKNRMCPEYFIGDVPLRRRGEATQGSRIVLREEFYHIAEAITLKQAL